MAKRENEVNDQSKNNPNLPDEYRDWIRKATEEPDEVKAPEPDEVVTKGGGPRANSMPPEDVLGYKPVGKQEETKKKLPVKALAGAAAAVVLIAVLAIGIKMFAGSSREDRVLQRDYGCIGDETTNELMSKEETIFGSIDRDSFKHVKFLDTVKSAPDDAVDVSETQHGKVLAWVDEDTLYIAAKGGVIANSDSSRIFAYCDNLESVDFNDCFDTEETTLMNHLFYRCGRLREVRFAGVDTGNVTSMQRMFVHDTSLTDPDVGNFDTKNVNSLYAMFRECTSLQALDLSEWDTSKVSNMARLFDGCTSLAKLELGDFDTSFATSFRYMFYDCYALTAIDLSSFNTSNVTDMMAMFSNCVSLRSLSLGNFDTSNVTDMGFMFHKCGSLAMLDVSSFDVSNLKNAEAMFYGCRDVKGYGDWGFEESELFTY